MTDHPCLDPDLERLVSGGQTGVDRAALDAARAAGIPIGGWCPAGRRAEDGPIDAAYPLLETPGRNYAQRTRWNVRDSDGTLILHRGPLRGGTRLTAQHAARLRRPLLLVDLEQHPTATEIRQWLRRNRVRVLNVAGPRELGSPGIGAMAGALMRRLFETDQQSP